MAAMEDDNNRRQEAAAATVQMAAMAMVLLDSVSYPRRNVLGLLAIYGAGAPWKRSSRGRDETFCTGSATAAGKTFSV
jgi:hypothetical protein